MTRFIVEVMSTTIAPSAVCTRPSLTIPIQPSDAMRELPLSRES